MDKKIQAIIFDMGGVIILTCDDSSRIALARQLGITTEELINAVFSGESAIRSEEGKIDKQDHWKNVLQSFGKDSIQNVTPYDDAFWAGDCIDSELMKLIENKRDFKI